VEQGGRVDALVGLFQQLHDDVRRLVEDCDDEALNFVPCSGANSIATIVTHLVGSEAEALKAVAGVSATRDREAEFTRGRQLAGELLRQLDDADQLLDELAVALTDARLAASMTLPTMPRADVRPGVTWLVGNYGHSREHVGHAALTKQLYDAAWAGSRGSARPRPSDSGSR
jgi:hypothetical protein